MKKALVVLVVMLVCGQAILAQDGIDCSADGIAAQVGDVMAAYETAEFADTAAALEATDALRTDIAAIVVSCRAAVYTGLMLDDSTIPLESWVIGSDLTGFLDEDRDRYGIDTSCFYGFLFIDHDAGIQLQLESYCETVDDGSIQATSGPAAEKGFSLLLYDVFENFSLRSMTDAEREVLALPAEPEWLSVYQSPHYELLRAIRAIDHLRAPGYPDDILAYAMPQAENQDIEALWVRLDIFMQEGRFQGILLNQPFREMGLNLGDRVIVETADFDGEIVAVIVAVVQE